MFSSQTLQRSFISFCLLIGFHKPIMITLSIYDIMRKTLYNQKGTYILDLQYIFFKSVFKENKDYHTSIKSQSNYYKMTFIKKNYYKMTNIPKDKSKVQILKYMETCWIIYKLVLYTSQIHWNVMFRGFRKKDKWRREIFWAWKLWPVFRFFVFPRFI